MSNIPTTLGKYQIIREIARSNDIVYEAYDPVMNRRVALKELAVIGGSTAQQKEDRIRRFLREAKAAGSLAHPNIVTIYEVGEEGDRHFLAMEFLDGHTLRNELDTQGFLPLERAVEIAESVLEGLEYAHKNGVIHRDIKPDNIQLLTDGRVKLTDFGIARLTFEPNLTMDGQVFGTPSYMSPEQVIGKELDLRSDLFSVGVVLYEMLSGHKPFQGDSVVTITYAIMNKEPERLDQLSYPIWQVIERALDKSPGQRYSTAREMIDAIHQALASAKQQVIDPMFPVQAPPQLNPFGQVPTGNPYMMPAPSPTYSQNPYQTPYPQQSQLPPATIGAPPVLLPVYYPPPPRRPLFKPETKAFLGKLGITIAVLGTLFTLILVGMGAISDAVGKYRLENADKGLSDKFHQSLAKLSLDEKISAYQAYLQQLKSPEMLKFEEKNLAVLHEEKGKKLAAAGDVVNAEDSYLEAARLDPGEAAYPSDLASLYGQNADRNVGEARLQLLEEASAQWERAALMEKDDAKRRSYRNGVAIAKYQHALANSNNDKTAARGELRDALEFAEPGSRVAADIQALIDQLTR